MDSDNTLTRQELLSCLELGKALTSELDATELYGRILQKVSDLLPAENWSLFLIDSKSGDLRFELCVGLDFESVKDVRLRLGEGVVGQAAFKKMPIVIEDVAGCDFFFNKVDKISGCETKSIICVPLIFGGKVLGVIEVVNHRYSKNKALQLISIIADYAAIAVENMNQYREIQRLVNHDHLTGLYNTRYLYKVLSKLIEENKGSDRTLSLIFMDLDNFKSVVDKFGHLKGSQALVEVADTIKTCLTGPEFGVAYGGDEFVIVLPETNKNSAIQKAEKIRYQMSQTTYLSGHGHAVSIRASFGVATHPDDSIDLTGLIGLADKAMFDVKGEGKNGIRPAQNKVLISVSGK
jgi:diguanylate cyclase (GGDEF)-like protein